MENTRNIRLRRMGNYLIVLSREVEWPDLFAEDAEDSLQWREERHRESSWASLAVVQTRCEDGFECQVGRSGWILDILQRWSQQNHWWARCQSWKKKKYQRWLRVFTLSSWEDAGVGGLLQEEESGESAGRTLSLGCHVHDDWGPGGDVKPAAGSVSGIQERLQTEGL